MKLKKNDLIELKKGGKKVLVAKLAEAKAELGEAKIEKFKTGQLKNVRLASVTRRAIAQLNTLIGLIKE